MSRKTVAAKFLDEEYEITVTGRNVLVTDAMKDYAIDKISKVNRFDNRITGVTVTMDVQNKIEHKIDITLKVDQVLIKSSAACDNMYASIDKAVDRLQAQLRRYNRRIHEHHLKGGDSIDMNVHILEAPADDLTEVNEEIEAVSREREVDSFRSHKIVSSEVRPLKTLTYGEAIMKMDLSGDRFMVFRSEEDQHLKVIYRRSDNNFGIIEPEK
jgi:putative sigma-54 modulation protein